MSDSLAAPWTVEITKHLKNASNTKVHAKSLQLCLTLCNLIDGNPPDFSVHGILSPSRNTGVGCHFLL